MTDYRAVMKLLVQQRSYRQIEQQLGCSHRTISRSNQVLRSLGIRTVDQVLALTDDELDELFVDGRSTGDGRFFSVPVGRYRVPGCWWLPVPVFYPRLRLLGLTQPFGYGRAHPFLFDVVAGSHVFSRQGEFRAVVGKTGHHRVRQCCL